MSLSFIGIASAFAELVPSLSKWFGEDAELTGHQRRSLVDHVLSAARQVTKTADTESALRSLQKNPELLLSFQKEILKLERSLQKQEIQDRRSARSRDAAFIAQGRQNIRADIMVLSAAMGLLACLVSIAYFKNELPGEAVGIISTIAGIFGSCLKDAYSFEFGSSRGSKAKDMASYLKAKKF